MQERWKLVKWFSDCAKDFCMGFIICLSCVSICYIAQQLRIYTLFRYQLRVEAIKSIMQAPLSSSDSRTILLEKVLGDYGL